MLLVLVALLMTSIQPVSTGSANSQAELGEGQGLVALAFASNQTPYVALSRDHGRTFGPAVQVSAESVMARRHRGPRVAILKDAIVVTAVLADGGDLATWRSVDQGQTWARAGVANDTPGAAREGLHAMAADQRGNLFAAWLDLRSKGTKLFGSHSADGGRTWSRNMLLYESPDGTICQCCAPSLAIDGQDQVSVMWRNVLDGSRDLYIRTSADGKTFGPARKAGAGTWKLNACPMDGGGLVVDRGQLVSAWRRDGDVFLDRAGEPEVRVGTGKDVAIATGVRGVYVAWSNGGVIEALTPQSRQPIRLAEKGAYVTLLGLKDGAMLAAWENGGSIETRRIEP